ncbi:MAG TPA: class I SAM-dependent methyltransferase [Nitrososphaeraceae archaeon]|jgi:predicted O-methyltransferase YrrM|nr:class I SAM-dependent methyltransferase [Nitrososphaeraceae archaeon]
MIFDRKFVKFIESFVTPEDKVLQDFVNGNLSLIKYPEMISGHLQGKILEFLSVMINPTNILEIGTYVGYSAIALSKGLKKEGRLDTIERDTSLKNIIHNAINLTNNADKIFVHFGDFFDVYDSINLKHDLVYIDGDKNEYIDYFNKIFINVNPGKYILVDNLFWGEKAFDPLSNKDDVETTGIKMFISFIRDFKGISKILLPIRDGLLIIRKDD